MRRPGGRARAGLAGLALLLALVSTGTRAAAERILALAPHVVETLYAIGAGPEIVGAVSFSDFPEAARALPRVGNYRKVSVEGALRLRPSLAIVMDEGVVGVRKLREFGVRVELSHPKTVEGVLRDIVHLGSLTGHEDEAEQVAAGLRERLEALRLGVPERPPRVFYEVWHQPLITAGGGDFISDALTRIGAQNIFASLAGDNPRVSVEAVLRARPDIFIIPGESRDVGERARAWRELMEDPELKVVEAPHDLFHRPGPRLIEGMEQLQAELRRALASDDGAP
ncbi:MAG: cobalamin-binding protein [Deltaproteobacteria bacterium]|jgi:ABC-type Fe3+-hydroxamate transport system substrate-binding protein|nr:cobalamin-binding protein [Deltaproteobacteria bacterium]